MTKEGKADPRQQSFDWTRAQRLKHLDLVELPKMPGTTPAKMLAVLRCLESHCFDKSWCRVKSETIASKVNTTSRSVRRALAALEDLVLLERKRTGRSSQYRIWWSNLQDFVPQVVAKETAAMSDQSGHHVRSDRTSCPVRADAMSDQIGHYVRSTETSFETHQEPPPPPAPGATWQEAAAAVARCEVGRVPETIQAARTAGVDPTYVLACVAMVEASAGAFGGGALRSRLLQASPHVAPESLHAWPKPHPPTPREQRAVQLLEAIREAYPDWDPHVVRSKFEEVARTDPQRAPPEQARIAAKFACPFDPREIRRAWFQVCVLEAFQPVS